VTVFISAWSGHAALRHGSPLSALHQTFDVKLLPCLYASIYAISVLSFIDLNLYAYHAVLKKYSFDQNLTASIFLRS
jgi:hypothetical protein